MQSNEKAHTPVSGYLALLLIPGQQKEPKRTP